MIIKGVIFDLDETLVDTRVLTQFRDERKWSKAIRLLSKTIVYPGIKEMLDELYTAGVSTGIVTSSPRKYAEAVVDYHGLDIPVLCAYQDTGRHKPSSDPILFGINRLGIPRDTVLTVGDSEIDIIAGKAAGTLTGYTGWGEKKELSTIYIQPNYIFKTPNKLLKIFQMEGLVS